MSDQLIALSGSPPNSSDAVKFYRTFVDFQKLIAELNFILPKSVVLTTYIENIERNKTEMTKKMTLSLMKPIVVDDREIMVAVATPNWKSVQAVWQNKGFVQNILEEFECMSSQARRKFAKKAEKQRKVLKLIDGILNDQQKFRKNGRIIDTEPQREFNTDALKIAIWDHFVEGSPILLVAQPNQELVTPTLH